MEEKQLYTQYDINGDYIYYLDKECTKAFSGHIEDYDRGALCMEADVVDGYMNGIHKEYFDNSTQLKQICFYKKNVQFGLYMDFYETGSVHYLCFAICNEYYDSYEFFESGVLKKKEIWPNVEFYDVTLKPDEKILNTLREKFNLEKISEEIQRDGKNFDYGKYFKN